MITERVKTGIPGLDELLDGGLTRGSCVLLCGPPGSGKTTFGLQYLYRGAVDYGERGVYVTLNQPPEEVMRGVSLFGMDLKKLKGKGMFSIIDLTPVSVDSDGRVLLQLGHADRLKITGLISKMVNEIKASRLVIDPINAITMHLTLISRTLGNIKIIKQSDILEQLTQRIQNDLKENGVVYSDIQWKQISESLSENQVTGFFENFAFYNPKDDVLYINQKMITNHPEKIIPVCTHELSEKLLATYLSPSPKTPVRVLVEAYIEAKKTNNTKKPYELLNAHTDIILKSIFKEGICEAIALQTLRRIDSEMKVASFEKDLEIGHSKCID